MDNKAFISSLTCKTGLDHKTAATFCELIFTELQETLTNLDSVSVSGFGTFSAEKKEEHISFDPVTKEQVNVEGITNGDSLSIQANWPSSISDFQWAIYNKNGDLYTEATTDISQANESVIITLQGDGSIDTINTTFK